MAFLRTVPRCCAGKKIFKCVPLPVVGLRDQNAVSAALVRLIERGYVSTGRVTGSVQQPMSDQSRQIDPLDLKFNDPVAAFKSKTTMELVRAYVVYQICSIEYLVENNMKVSIHRGISILISYSYFVGEIRQTGTYEIFFLSFAPLFFSFSLTLLLSFSFTDWLLFARVPLLICPRHGALRSIVRFPLLFFFFFIPEKAGSPFSFQEG